MLRQFQDYIAQQHLITPGDEVLLAVSGGRDSVAMVHLMHSAGIPFAIAHCNFHLRPGDCDRDEAFVRRLAQDYGVPCHVAQFDTRSVSAATGESVEEAARRLRYEYFAQIARQVATAHHLDDSVETFFLNLFRGTGISGLHGIRPLSTFHFPLSTITVVRPLLCFTRADIDAYVETNHLAYVEDCTNAQLDARRNRIRHQLMPLLRELYPSVDTTMAANIERLHDTELLYRQYISELRSRLVKPYRALVPDLPFEILSIDLRALNSALLGVHGGTPLLTTDFRPPTSALTTLLFELLHPYGFNAATVADIIGNQSVSQSGRLFYSKSHVAECHRGLLLVAPDVEPGSGRHPQPGDRIRLKNGSRLLSDYLKDMNLSRIERRHLLLNLDEQGNILPLAKVTL